MSETSTSKISPLTSSNYRIWADDMKDWLQIQGIWRLVDGREKKPSDPDKLEKWEIKSDKAAGAIRSTISPELKVHIRDCEDDPALIWSSLKSVFIQQRTAPRFNAYHDLLSVQKQEDESIDSMINRVDQQIRIIKSLTPSSFTLNDLYDELAAMAIIRGLPGDFKEIIHTLSVLDKFKKDEVITALKNLTATSSPLTPSIPALSSTSFSSQKKSKPTSKCEFCGRLGHTEEKCYTKARVKQEVQQKVSAQDQLASSQPPSTTPTPTASIASLASSLSSPSPLQHNSYYHWNADTGASAHMTPHRHWLRNFRPFHTKIQLANGSAIYAEGTGTVQFKPVVDGQELRTVEFSNVLYVPKLQNNLLSVLFLTKHRHFDVHTAGDTMHFTLDNTLIFEAKVNASNSAFLQGSTIPLPLTANLSSTPPLDLNLWHKRLCHHNLDGVKKLISQKLVTGLHINSPNKPDPICEPCLADKMHTNPFPSSSHRKTEPLELIHSDIHGPIKVASHSGFKYWALFIDDCTGHRAAIPMRAKSDTFSAFKRYKALVEKRFGRKIKALRDDKGGEYIVRSCDATILDNGGIVPLSSIFGHLLFLLFYCSIVISI